MLTGALPIAASTDIVQYIWMHLILPPLDLLGLAGWTAPRYPSPNLPTTLLILISLMKQSPPLHTWL